MQDLRLIGVHEDGRHLLLVDAHGARYRVPLDDPLRAAARHQRTHPGGHVSVDVVAGHRPREVQALIRAGLSAQEVAERCGWPVEKVHKYEVPILAEREYVAGLAKLVRLRSRGAASASPTLAGRVAGRLEARGVDADDVSWDAWRLAGAEWTVVLSFPAGGKQRQATWGFDPSTNAVHPRDDEARWFSEDDPATAAEVVPREVPVYDVEAEGGVGAGSEGGSGTGPADPLDLVTAMRQRTSARSRRGARRRPAEDPALPHDTALPLEAQAPVNGTGPEVTVASSAHRPEPQSDVAPEGASDADDAPSAELAQGDGAADNDGPGATDDAPGGGSDGLPLEGLPDVLAGQPLEQTREDAVAGAASAAVEVGGRAARRPARVSVPSWDEVILGAKPAD